MDYIAPSCSIKSTSTYSGAKISFTISENSLLKRERLEDEDKEAMLLKFHFYRLREIRNGRLKYLGRHI